MTGLFTKRKSCEKSQRPLPLPSSHCHVKPFLLALKKHVNGRMFIKDIKRQKKDKKYFSSFVLFGCVLSPLFQYQLWGCLVMGMFGEEHARTRQYSVTISILFSLFHIFHVFTINQQSLSTVSVDTTMTCVSSSLEASGEFKAGRLSIIYMICSQMDRWQLKTAGCHFIYNCTLCFVSPHSLYSHHILGNLI